MAGQNMHRPIVRDVPQADYSIAGAGGDQIAIGTQRQVTDLVGHGQPQRPAGVVLDAIEQAQS